MWHELVHTGAHTGAAMHVSTALCITLNSPLPQMYNVFQISLQIIKGCSCTEFSTGDVLGMKSAQTPQHRSALIIPTGFHFNFALTSTFGPPCPTQQRWPRCQLCFRAKMCFKSCCRMVMCCATCQPTSIPRQMGEAVVKKQAFLGYSQGVIYHIKAWHNRGLSYGICFPKDAIFLGDLPLFGANGIWH